MKYQAEIEINLPKKKVIDIYSKEILMWHHSLKEHKLIYGERLGR